MKKYFPSLDILRFFAVTWVMFFHYFLFYSGELHFYRYGNLGVQLFFIISGFVISFSIQEKSIKQFASSRLLRLYPLFWFTCTLTFIITVIVHEQIAFKDFILNMTMVGGLMGAKLFVDPVYWSLAVELFFYAFIATFTYFFSFSKVRIFYWSWFLIVLFFYIFHFDENIIGKFLLVRHASYFIFGGMLALIIEKIDQKIRPHIYDILFVATVAIFATIINARSLPPYFTPNPADHFWVTLINMLIFIIVPILIFLLRKLPHKINNIVIIIGGITYPFYLIHQRIGLILIEKLGPHLNYYLTYIVTFLIIISTSYFLYSKDKVFRKYLKNKIKFLQD